MLFIRKEAFYTALDCARAGEFCVVLDASKAPFEGAMGIKCKEMIDLPGRYIYTSCIELDLGKSVVSVSPVYIDGRDGSKMLWSYASHGLVRVASVWD